MPVKVVTDSTSDIPPQVVEELGITVVPVYLRFGSETYRDGVDIGPDEFYRRLVVSKVHPSTSQPTPADFADVYRRLAQETDEIVSLHLSQKTSGTYDSALQGREMAPAGCKIEVVDTFSVSMGLGLIAMAAARLAKAGEGSQRVMDEVRQAIPCIRLLGVFDTLKYLLLGGRVSRARAIAGGVLSIKPLITMRDGNLVQAGIARTRNKGIERLFDLVKNTLNLQEVAIVHSTTPDEASSLRERITAIFAEERVHVARLGPALGVHAGPGTLLLALREKVSGIRQDASEGEHLKKRFSLPSLPKTRLRFSRLQA